MNITKTDIDGVLVIEPDVYGDARGYFMETWNGRTYERAGLNAAFVQDNLSFSSRGVLRGLHYQHPQSQGKLVQVFSGKVLDVAVDIRRGSPTFGQWTGCLLSGDNHKQFFVPVGFAHGFCVLSETALFSYKCTDFYNPDTEGGLLWNDPAIGIDWPIREPVLSRKDTANPLLKDIPDDKLPVYEGRS